MSQENSEIKQPNLPNVEYSFDVANAQPIKHIWIDRGHVLSCENAGHPNHRVFKRV